MLHEMTTDLSESDVLDRAKSFFTARVPHYGVYLEGEGRSYATFRGQGGEEITIAVSGNGPVTRIRASTLQYDQAIERFFSTLPRVEPTVG